jgi:hypothetical protein
MTSTADDRWRLRRNSSPASSGYGLDDLPVCDFCAATDTACATISSDFAGSIEHLLANAPKSNSPERMNMSGR